MFNIPVKKLKGIEKGSFVVLNASIREYSKLKNLEGDSNSDSYLTNRYTELMYVVDDDTLGDGKFISCIPVIYNTNDTWQSDLFRRIHAKKTLIMHKKESVSSIYIDPQTYIDDVFPNCGYDFGRIARHINFAYSDRLKKAGIYIHIEE